MSNKSNIDGKEPPICPPCEAEDDGWEAIQDSHIEPVSWDEGGAENVDIDDIDDDVVVQQAIPLPAPLQPSKAHQEAHNLTHWPYRSWCPHCVAARRPNSQHRRNTSSAERTVPLMVADYCFVRDNEDKTLAKVLVVNMEPSDLLLCTVVDEKGVDEPTILRLAQFIKESGYSHLAYRSNTFFCPSELCLRLPSLEQLDTVKSRLYLRLALWVNPNRTERQRLPSRSSRTN